MTEITVKQQVLKAVSELPADATFEDAMERLYLLYKVEQGRRQIEAGQGIPHEEAKKRIKTWHE
jgi:predicted transcriptional regulator